MTTQRHVGNTSRHGRRTRAGLMAAAALLALSSQVSAQFDDFAWTHVGDPSGSATVSSTVMDIVGPSADACTTSDTFAHMLTSTSMSGTVTAQLSFDNQDGGFGFWAAEDPVFVLNGKLDYLGPGDFFDLWEGDVSVHVEAGDSFGFGVQSIDCSWGPGVLQVTSFEFEADTWQQLGHGLAGSQGEPLLVGLGALQPATPYTLSLVDAQPNSAAWLVIGAATLNAPFKGGVLVPDPTPPSLILVLLTSPNGRIVINDTWPSGLPGGASLAMQYWIQDPGGPLGWSASNAVEALLP
jgi:hypothetical protein